MKRNTITSISQVNKSLALSRKALQMGYTAHAYRILDVLGTVRIARKGGRPAVTAKGCDFEALMIKGLILVYKDSP